MAGAANSIPISAGRMTTAQDRASLARAAEPTIRRECRKAGSQESNDNSASLMNTTTLRAVCNGHAVELREGWTLRKRNYVAVCRLWSHELGWELRLEVGELFRTHVRRSVERSSERRRRGRPR